jgi:hypothetical protein
MRQFIRHPAEVPIEVSATGGSPGPLEHARNVSAGGLALRCGAAFPADSIVHVRIACVRPTFETDARVVWCSACPGGFELGVEFLEADDAFRARMVEQVCRIEQYRAEVRARDGRELTSDEAAAEWIARYAAAFADEPPG